MSTKFKLLFDRDELSTELYDFQKSLPSEFVVEKEDDGVYITIQSELDDYEQCQDCLNRELDRYYFLTAEKIGSERVCNTGRIGFTIEQTVYGPLPEGLGSQCWNDELPIQLRLWLLAVEADDLVLKAILFFQIIELTYPDTANQIDYPKYDVLPRLPELLTEAKLVRNWVTHAGKPVSQQAKNYCKYLEIPEVMFDRANDVHVAKLYKKLTILEGEAKKVITASILLEGS